MHLPDQFIAPSRGLFGRHRLRHNDAQGRTGWNEDRPQRMCSTIRWLSPMWPSVPRCPHTRLVNCPLPSLLDNLGIHKWIGFTVFWQATMFAVLLSIAGQVTAAER